MLSKTSDNSIRTGTDRSGSKTGDPVKTRNDRSSENKKYPSPPPLNFRSLTKSIGLLFVLLAVLSAQAGAALLHHVETENVPQANDGFVLVSPDGKYVYTNASDSGNWNIRIFSRNQDTGELITEIAKITGDDILTGASFAPGMATLSADGADLYMLASFGVIGGQNPNQYADSIMHFKRDADTGLLIYQGRLATGIDFQDVINELTPPVISADGFFVYVGDVRKIFVFKRENNGALSLVEIVRKDSHGEDIGSSLWTYLALDKGGKSLYAVASGTTSEAVLHVFSRDPATGKLTPQQTFRNKPPAGVTGKPGIELEGFVGVGGGIAVSADGRFVYVAAIEDGGPHGFVGEVANIHIFSRDPDGKLTHLQRIVSIQDLGSGMVDTMHFRGYSIILGPEADEKFLYVSSVVGVNVFRRNSDGSLQWLELKRTAGSTGRMAMSADGKNLYTKGESTGAGIVVLDISTDLSVVKTDSTDPVAPGGNFTYTLAVTNNGPADALNVVVTDTLPAGVNYVSGSVNAPGATCSENGGTVTCNMGNIANTGSVNATIEVTAPSAEGTITNTASVKGDQADTETANSTDSEDTSIAAGGGTGSGGGSSSGGGGGTFAPGLLLLGLPFLRRRKCGS